MPTPICAHEAAEKIKTTIASMTQRTDLFLFIAHLPGSDPKKTLCP
jgi:hypothetical protein